MELRKDRRTQTARSSEIDLRSFGTPRSSSSLERRPLGAIGLRFLYLSGHGVERFSLFLRSALFLVHRSKDQRVQSSP